MDARRYVIPLLFAGLVLALVGSAGVVLARGPTVPATAPASQEPLGSAFTYQGRLLDGGNPANGQYDLQFGLFDSTDAAVGSLVELGNVSVTDGLFTVQLDFGDVFDGRRLWLQIGVRPGGSTGAYTVLGELQELTAVPYALYALDLGCPGCVNSTDIENGTIAFADIGQNGCLPGQVTKWNGAQWSCSNLYARTVIVSPVGSDAQNGNALLAALAGITGPSSSSPWLLKIEPGRYDLGSQSLAMVEWVDIEGSGEWVTTITASGSSSSDTGTVVGADNAELRFLTVKNTGGSDHAIAVYNGDTSPRLTHLTALASGGVDLNTAVYNLASTSTPPTPTMENVTAIASGGFQAEGVDNAGSAPTMKDVTARGYGATGFNYGIYNDTINIAMLDVTAMASGGSTARAIRNNDCSLAIMTNVTAVANGGTSENTAVYNQGSTAWLMYVTATAAGTPSTGLFNSGPAVTVDLSRIRGVTSSIDNVFGGVVGVGASQLLGGPVTGSGVTCAGVYDENYVFSSSTCP